MNMDSSSGEFSGSLGALKFDDETVSQGFSQSVNFSNHFIFKDDPPDLSFLYNPSLPPDPDSDGVAGNSALHSDLNSDLDSADDNELCDTTLKYLNQILMEEDTEGKPNTSYDPLALQAAENSFYEVLNKNYPSPFQPIPNTNQDTKGPASSYLGTSSEISANSRSSASNSTDSNSAADPIEFISSSSLNQKTPVESHIHPSLQSSSAWSLSSVNSSRDCLDGPEDSYAVDQLFPNIFSNSQSILQFNRGMEEASKFLPRGISLLIDLEKYTSPQESKEVKLEKMDNGLRGRKNHDREDSDIEEGRSSKQSTVCVDEAEMSEMFDKVLLSTEVKVEPPGCAVREELHTQNGQYIESNGGEKHAKKRGNKEEVDLRTLLISCAQSVAANDHRIVNEQIKQIRLHASPFGNGSQRLAHVFANAIEARLAGTGSQICADLVSKHISATDTLKAYQLHISACPFMKTAIFFADLKILEVAEKATKLHIIDFGILYGFQWPILIQRLSRRPGGPPKLRITGIDFPQPGFRPAERVEQTGRRLARYCERFNVQFEYNAISQKWETVQIEDLKIDNDEMLVVNCLLRSKNLPEGTLKMDDPRDAVLLRSRNLPDGTLKIDDPRDTVLKLIKTINPTIFLHTVVNGSHNSPFFVTRFREAVFHYSALFDIFDANIPCDDQERLTFEKEFLGCQIINVLACEGSERVERPESYRQWQARSMRAGFRMLPLNQEVARKLKAKVREACHKDFVIEDDKHWMLQGWKGRIIYASSCWVPA